MGQENFLKIQVNNYKYLNEISDPGINFQNTSGHPGKYFFLNRVCFPQSNIVAILLTFCNANSF